MVNLEFGVRWLIPRDNPYYRENPRIAPAPKFEVWQFVNSRAAGGCRRYFWRTASTRYDADAGKSPTTDWTHPDLSMNGTARHRHRRSTRGRGPARGTGARRAARHACNRAS